MVNDYKSIFFSPPLTHQSLKGLKRVHSTLKKLHKNVMWRYQFKKRAPKCGALFNSIILYTS